nr:SGNH/GDSL hydrolase family protein [Lachnospiraceae bacterium]
MSDNTFRGPAAPKDPTMKRPFYYIMKGKKVLGSPQSDGRGIQFIYESDGRLKTSAKLVGNLTDETMIEELTTAQGLKKQVHGVGVIVERAGEPIPVRFAFQMYGKKDPYASGTTLTMDVLSDGMERVLDFHDADWYGDDVVPGQIRFEFEKPGLEANVTVCFYLNDGYTAPPQLEDKPLDFSGESYSTIIDKSVLNKGNVHRLKEALEKARAGQEVTLGFIGGSITQGAGAIPINTECYAYNIFKGFCDLTGRKYDDNVK